MSIAIAIAVTIAIAIAIATSLVPFYLLYSLSSCPLCVNTNRKRYSEQ